MMELNFIEDALCDHCKSEGAYEVEGEFLCRDCLLEIQYLEDEADYLEDLKGE